MLKEESNETCHSCEADSVYLCTTCDALVRAPATFLCKADTVSLCTACDAEIHQRVPILPLEGEENEDDREIASWLLLNPEKSNGNNGFLFGVEYLDLVDYSSSTDNQFEDQYSVVPFQVEEPTSHLQQSLHKFELGISSSYSSGSYYNYDGSFKDLNRRTSMNISLVPDSTSDSRPPKETIHQLSCTPTQMVNQLTPMDREARVLRYREKKKKRKFEKTIRYASRKAYAEIRPRIKGRFVKRIEMDVEAEQVFSMSETGYGIVPSFYGKSELDCIL